MFGVDFGELSQINFKKSPCSDATPRGRRILYTVQFFIQKRMDVILIGTPGTGKTFPAKAIAFTACNNNIKVLFTTAIDMINHLIAAEADRSLLKKLHYYQSPDLLVCDELGYLSLGEQGSHLFFQVVSQRHRQKFTILTTKFGLSGMVRSLSAQIPAGRPPRSPQTSLRYHPY